MPALAGELRSFMTAKRQSQVGFHSGRTDNRTRDIGRAISDLAALPSAGRMQVGFADIAFLEIVKVEVREFQKVFYVGEVDLIVVEKLIKRFVCESLAVLLLMSRIFSAASFRSLA